jgi:glucose-6-phosphate 1-dehydrogenase
MTIMKTNIHTEPAVIVVFGAGGDLTQRKLIPALFSLFTDGWLPEQFLIIGLDRVQMNDQAFRQHLCEGVDRYSRQGKVETQVWDRFASHLTYTVADFTDPEAFDLLSEQIAAQEEKWGQLSNQIFYLATPPTMMETIARLLHHTGLSDNHERARIVFEKPFGHDLESARALNNTLSHFFFAETQIYRIDHYLGKETVQNILALRFANALFEPIWDRRYIDQVQITVAETVGVEHRGGYYDQAGALRDMIQNHLLQILCLIAMEPPVSFGADEIRNKKVDLLHAIRTIPCDAMEWSAVRGQYGKGQIDGEDVPAYRHEPCVSADSNTETYAALRLCIDNWRWQNVPFYLRTGKRLPIRASEVSVIFRPVPHQSFPPSALEGWQPNRLVIHVQPDEGLSLRVQAKRPGLRVQLNPADMQFRYQDVFESPSPEAYETLLLDILLGDATLFMRADQIETAWSIVDPVLEAWAAKDPVGFPNYAAGSWGPEAAEALLARDGRHWLAPIVEEKRGKHV